jgi:hypothetical protein
MPVLVEANEMKSKKSKIIAGVGLTVLALAVMLSGLVSCSSSADMVDNYKSMDDLIKDSPIIVIGTVDGGNEEVEYSRVTFALTTFKVETAIRGTVPGTINILQTKMSEDPYINNGDRMLLFLVKYTGPVSDNAYRMKGLYQGQYKIDGTKVIRNGDNKLTGSEILESLDSLISRINAVEYSPVNMNAPVSE